LNKSGFYHHFGDREAFFHALIQYHHKINLQFCDEISFSNSFNPDFLKQVIKYKTAVLVQMQLRKNSDVSMFKEAFDITKKRNANFIIPLWADFLKISDNNSLAAELYTIFQEVFFMRITSENLTQKFAEGIAMNFSLIRTGFLKFTAGYLFIISRSFISSSIIKVTP
jgi:AcrR family transcriptional regulator